MEFGPRSRGGAEASSRSQDSWVRVKRSHRLVIFAQ